MNEPQPRDELRDDLRDELRQTQRRLDRMDALAERQHLERQRLREEREELRAFLDLAPQAEQLLEELTQSLFGEVLDDIEANLTHAIHEILGQNRKVASTRDIHGSQLSVEFHLENEGNREDIMHATGGSVCNILSTGLRLIALSQLDERRHRPFLVLDEQDCWLRPDLVPRFMDLVARIAERLGLQVLVISHHPVDLFAEQASAVWSLRPQGRSGAKLQKLSSDVS